MATWKKVCSLVYTVQCVQRFPCHTCSPRPAPGCGAALECIIQTVLPSMLRCLIICAVEPHAVIASDLQAGFGGGDVGAQVLQAMVRMHDALMPRPCPCKWGDALPQHAQVPVAQAVVRMRFGVNSCVFD